MIILMVFLYYFIENYINNISENKIIKILNNEKYKDKKLLILLLIIIINKNVKELKFNRIIVTSLLNEYNIETDINIKNTVAKCLTLYLNESIVFLL